MRTVGSLVLAIIGIIAFSNATDEFGGALAREWSASFLEAGIWLTIAGIAFFCALRIRGATWAIVLPCGLMMALSAFLSVLFQRDAGSHFGMFATFMLVLTLVMVQLGRARTELSDRHR